MAIPLSRAVVIGHVGREPEARYLQNADLVVDFSIATNKKHKGRDGQQESLTTWRKVSAYGKLAELIQQHVHMGMSVYVEGEEWLSTWTDRDGKEHVTLEMRCSEFRTLDSREATAPTTTHADRPEEDESDIDF